ncbi:MAG: response regulator [Planctomycetota bacterium]|jgi:DNA-binding NtrC family response regulator
MRFKILIVDDEQQITTLLSRHLRMEGYDVETSNDPLEAIEMVKKKNFHIVISDIDMPHMTGIDMLKEIRTYNGGMHVIMITGKITLSNVLDAMRRGADTCIFKPFKDLQVITDAVEDACNTIVHWHEILKTLQSGSFESAEAA